MAHQLSLPFPPGEFRIITGGSSCVVQGTGKVMVPGMFTYTVGGEVVGKLDGVFDFSDLPPELHVAAVRDIQSHGMRLELGWVAHLYWPNKYEDPSPPVTELVKQVESLTERVDRLWRQWRPW